MKAPCFPVFRQSHRDLALLMQYAYRLSNSRAAFDESAMFSSAPPVSSRLGATYVICLSAGVIVGQLSMKAPCFPVFRQSHRDLALLMQYAYRPE